MGTLLHLSDQEVMMGFVASCIEDAADKLGVDYSIVYERMKKAGLIEGFLIPHYNVLHTESRENVTASILETLKHWEDRK